MTEQVQTQAPATVTEAPKVELTASEKRVKRIEETKALLARLENEHSVAESLAAITKGSEVTVRLGRAETAREVVAVVLGTATDEKGVTRYKVYSGDGFEACTDVILGQQIVNVIKV